MGGPASKETWEQYAEGGEKKVETKEETKSDTVQLNEIVPEKKDADTTTLNETTTDTKATS